MSAPTVPHDYVGDQPGPKTATRTRRGTASRALHAVASLRLTVVLFGLSMVLVFFGTLGMMHDSIEETMKRYFRSWYVFIELRAVTDFGKVFLGFGPDAHLPGKLPFPGGYTIGWLMFVNLLAAHAIRFKLTWRRSGIFLLHAGVIVLLAGEFLTGQLAVETRMMIKEGESARFVFSLTDYELAVIDPSDPGHDDVTVVPAEKFVGADPDAWFSHPDVPVEIQKLEYHPNARLRNLKPDEAPAATQGLGRHAALDPRPKVKGTDSTGEVNYPAVVLAFRDRAGRPLGTYLFATAQEQRLQDLTVDGKAYKVTFRFKRTYKPYVVHLDRAEHDVYPGTTVPKDFASTVRVQHPQLGEHGPIRIWMNHPMYYEGETFYQSGMHTDEDTGVKTTTLQVVRNEAWTFPYFACALVGLGMAFHFLLRLTTFLRKRPAAPPATVAGRALDRYVPLGLVALAALMLAGRLLPPSARDGKKDLYAFGQIPVQHGGRIQPADSVARNSLMVISGKQEFVDTADNDRTYPAIDWLLTVWAKPDRAEKYRIFRVDHPQVLSLLGLAQRPGSYRYSMAELEEKGGIDKLRRQALVASKKPKEKRDLYDQKLIELAGHVEVYQGLYYRKNPGLIPTDDPDAKWLSYGDVVETAAPQFFREADATVRKELTEELHRDPGLIGLLADRHLGGVGFKDAVRQLGGEQQVLAYVVDQEVRRRVAPLARENFLKSLPDTFPPAATMEKILTAYRDDDAAGFNAAVAEYREKHTAGVSAGDKSRVRLEALMNHFDPFLQCQVLYLMVVLLSAPSWLVAGVPLRRAAFGLACLTLVVHTAALLARMYIGNRPPVTNLYSSAVFIGWGGLVLCLALERIYKLGVGTFAGGALGFATMYIARFLAESGDTLEMLQAVLDTNFWLATHVTCVTLGYVATAVAGMIGLVYIVGGVFTNGMRGDEGKKVAGMLYGTLCFATLLSFVGTVLGGIWADQSWGRFWGWDPKENGAVLIVIWNALILHARWAGLVKPRGMAILAVVGNMVVAWSWFGTNQLGIGLHAYGFDNRLATGCALFWVSQLLVVALGLIPPRYWASLGPPQPAKA